MEEGNPKKKNRKQEQKTLNDFREAWRNMVNGQQNVHKIPILKKQIKNK